jgi:heme A synthase
VASGANGAEKRDAEAVDRWINRLGSDGKPVRVTGPYAGPLPTMAVAARTAAHTAARTAARTAFSRSFSSAPLTSRPLGIRLFVGLSLALGVALPYWPYSSVCGWGLIFHALAVIVLLVAGVWTSILTWHGRLGLSHVLAILIFCWALTLSALEVLPRTGYAKAEATWWCGTN